MKSNSKKFDPEITTAGFGMAISCMLLGASILLLLLAYDQKTNPRFVLDDAKEIQSAARYFRHDTGRYPQSVSELFHRPENTSFLSWRGPYLKPEIESSFQDFQFKSSKRKIKKGHVIHELAVVTSLPLRGWDSVSSLCKEKQMNCTHQEEGSLTIVIDMQFKHNA